MSPAPDSAIAEQLILDGQQRLTTLTQVLALKAAVATRTDKGKPIERHDYWHILTAIDPDATLEDALIPVEADRKRRINFGRDVDLDLSTTQLECEQMYLPCGQTRKSDAWESALIKISVEKFQTYMAFREKVLDSFREYQVPAIKLQRATSKEAVCLVFEKFNTGGVDRRSEFHRVHRPGVGRAGLISMSPRVTVGRCARQRLFLGTRSGTHQQKNSKYSYRDF